MNRGMKIMLLLVVVYVCATTIAASIDTTLLPSISDKKGIRNYISKKLPTPRWYWLEQYLQRHPKFAAAGKQLYRYRYLAGAAALLALGGYYGKRLGSQPLQGGAPKKYTDVEHREQFNRRWLLGMEAFERYALYEENLLFITVQNKIGALQRLLLTIDQSERKSRSNVQERIASLEELLHVLHLQLIPSQKELFCQLLHNFHNFLQSGTHLFDQDIKVNATQLTGNVIRLSHNPELTRLLDLINSDIDVYIFQMQYRAPGLYEYKKWKKLNNIINYYRDELAGLENQTIFSPCGTLSISREHTNIRLFEYVAYVFIKILAANNPSNILHTLRNKPVLINYTFDALPVHHADLLSLWGVVNSRDTSWIYSGKNKIGKMIVFIVRELYKPQFRDLVLAVQPRAFDEIVAE